MMCNREVRMNDVIKYLIDLWSQYKFDEKEPPLMFSDSFARAMFFGSLLKTVKRFYKIGIKDERKRRKYSCIKRFKKRTLIVKRLESAPVPGFKVYDI